MLCHSTIKHRMSVEQIPQNDGDEPCHSPPEPSHEHWRVIYTPQNTNLTVQMVRWLGCDATGENLKVSKTKGFGAVVISQCHTFDLATHALYTRGTRYKAASAAARVERTRKTGSVAMYCRTIS
jgi:hypothetical protein